LKLPPTWTAAWARMAPREKLLVASAAAVIGLALLWWLLVAPALSVLRAAETQHRALDATLARMRALQQQAQALQSQPKMSADEASRQLEASVRQRLGTSARITVAGDRVTVTLTGVAPDAFASWLAQARVDARALPTEARLTRGTTGGWDGTVVLALPPR